MSRAGGLFNGGIMSGSRIGYESANQLASAWNPRESIIDNFKKIGIQSDKRNLYRFRRQAEEILGFQLKSEINNTYHPRTAERYDLDHEYTIAIFSDAHFWPFETTDAFYIFLEIIQEIQPEVVLNNGDSLDGATISRHPANGWENPPSLVDELDANREHLELVKEAAGEADLYWCEGNHDKRFEMFLAKQAPQFRDMPGTTLKGLFPDWKICDSVFFNDLLQVKHRWHNGVHAAYNNTLKSGKSMATGHTHRLTCREYTDLNGTRYGIECGTLADIYGPQFSYTENNPVQWQQGFPILTIDKNGLHVELVQVINGKARFRGKVYG